MQIWTLFFKMKIKYSFLLRLIIKRQDCLINKISNLAFVTEMKNSDPWILFINGPIFYIFHNPTNDKFRYFCRVTDIITPCYRQNRFGASYWVKTIFQWSQCGNNRRGDFPFRKFKNKIFLIPIDLLKLLLLIL